MFNKKMTHYEREIILYKKSYINCTCNKAEQELKQIIKKEIPKIIRILQNNYTDTKQRGVNLISVSKKNTEIFYTTAEETVKLFKEYNNIEKIKELENKYNPIIECIIIIQKEGINDIAIAHLTSLFIR